jgi:hypothetical protein
MARRTAWAGLLVLLATATGSAVPLWPVMDTPTYVAKAKDVLVVRCLDPNVPIGTRGTVDGLTLVEVEVLAVVKGERTAGKTRLATLGQPMTAGARYLVGSFGGDAFGTGFLAQSDQAVVELPPDFDLKQLEGTSAAEQAEAVFVARKAQVERLLRLLQREKDMLDRATGKQSPGK